MIKTQVAHICGIQYLIKHEMTDKRHLPLITKGCLACAEIRCKSTVYKRGDKND